MSGQTNPHLFLTRSARTAFVKSKLLQLFAVAVLACGFLLLTNQNANAQPRRDKEETLVRLLKGSERAKTIREIPAAFVAAIKREYESSPETQKETEFDPYLANTYFRAIETLELAEGRLRLPQMRPITMCTDGTCDGPLNTSVWSGAWTGGSPTTISNANLPIAAWTAGLLPNNNTIPINSCGLHPSQAHHSIVPSGNDPTIPSITTVAPIPATGNTASLRLGNTCPNCGGERVTKTFTVAAGQTTLQFWYATVLQDPGHPPSDQPGFGAYLLNGSTLIPNRIDLDPSTAGKQDFVVADRNNPFFGFNSALSVVYHDWTCVTIDLSGLEGQAITLLLVNRDCTQGGHWGYTYVDSFCLGCAGSPTGDASFNPAKSDCATGKICFDYTVPKLPNGTTGQVNLSLGIYQNGVLVNTLTSGPLTTNGTFCFTNVAAGLNQSLGGFDWQATANFTITNATISPIIIGQTGDGHIPGKNNDCVIPPKPVDPCCPPWNKNILADVMFYQGSGSISAPYTLHFVSNPTLNGQMYAYINYLNSLNSAITSITLDWSLLDPSNLSLNNPASTTWNVGGSGNPVRAGDLNFFSLPTAFPMQVGTWYRVRAIPRLNRGQTFFPEKCSQVEMFVRIQVAFSRARDGVPAEPPALEISNDGKNVIQRIPLAPGRTDPIKRPNN